MDPALLSEAVVVWTGWGDAPRPRREDDRLVDRYGEGLALTVIPAVHTLEREFFASTAKDTEPGLQAMGDAAADDFRKLHPEVSEDAVQALTWCYVYDYK
jgi:hypothetical protein